MAKVKFDSINPNKIYIVKHKWCNKIEDLPKSLSEYVYKSDKQLEDFLERTKCPWNKYLATYFAFPGADLLGQIKEEFEEHELDVVEMDNSIKGIRVGESEYSGYYLLHVPTPNGEWKVQVTYNALSKYFFEGSITKGVLTEETSIIRSESGNIILVPTDSKIFKTYKDKLLGSHTILDSKARSKAISKLTPGTIYRKYDSQTGEVENYKIFLGWTYKISTGRSWNSGYEVSKVGLFGELGYLWYLRHSKNLSNKQLKEYIEKVSKSKDSLAIRHGEEEPRGSYHRDRNIISLFSSISAYSTYSYGKNGWENPDPKVNKGLISMDKSIFDDLDLNPYVLRTSNSRPSYLKHLSDYKYLDSNTKSSKESDDFLNKVSLSKLHSTDVASNFYSSEYYLPNLTLAEKLCKEVQEVNSKRTGYGSNSTDLKNEKYSEILKELLTSPEVASKTTYKNILIHR